MTKPIFSPDAGLMQDIVLLSAVGLFLIGFFMLIYLRIGDYRTGRKRRKGMMNQTGCPSIQ